MHMNSEKHTQLAMKTLGVLFPLLKQLHTIVSHSVSVKVTVKSSSITYFVLRKLIVYFLVHMESPNNSRF